EVSYQDIYIEAGKTLVLDKPTRIDGNVLVERGGSLLVDGADITIRGNIRVNGGRIQLCNSKWKIEKCDAGYFLKVTDAAVVKIENSIVDCKAQCGFLKQTAGRLLIEESEFCHSQKERMIVFDGWYAQITRSTFRDGKAGFISVFGASQVQITNCDFSGAESDYGSAVYSESIDNVTITESAFRECRAKYLGAAVYFKYDKLGQRVMQPVLYDCEPADSAIFNASRREA
ncbi:MAG: right-handed parallel beta-helix repeat-containing protein, partial [bacterium]|nr:right-handed parallel beta-helix repeat-containing protein [bacterium]